MSCDELKILSGEPIKINDFITLSQPSIDEIKNEGEQHFMSVFYSLCGIPSDMKSVLWDVGIDYCKISDWELFINTCRGFSKEDTHLVFGDLDFSKTVPMNLTTQEGEQEVVLVCTKTSETGELLPDEDKIITEKDYKEFIPYVREMFGYTAKPEKAANKATKIALIDEDRRKRKRNANKDYESTLVPIIISLVNTEEFSYTYKTIFEATTYQLMRSYIQIQKKKSACALFQGSMSGFVDTSKIKTENMQWIYTKQ